nr:tyrosine-protein kinase JAK2-like [Oncorhynchus nerka]
MSFGTATTTIFKTVTVGQHSLMDMESALCPSSNQNGCILNPLPVSETKQEQEVAPPPCLRVHLYHLGQGGANSQELTYPAGDYVAEELCIDAAKACGLSPLYCSLFCPLC